MKKGYCLWCGHMKMRHDGRVHQTVVADPANRGVRWSRSACNVEDCACRRYER